MGAPLALIAASIATVVILHWWALIVIPLGLAAWIGYYATSSTGRARLAPISILTIVAGLGIATDFLGRRELFTILTLYFVALWLGRFVYVSATAFLRAFVIRNPRAFSWLKAEIVLKNAAV